MSRSQPTQLPLFAPKAITRQAPRPQDPADRMRLQHLRETYDLCFETVAMHWMNHDWSIGKPITCKRCGMALQHYLDRKV